MKQFGIYKTQCKMNVLYHAAPLMRDNSKMSDISDISLHDNMDAKDEVKPAEQWQQVCNVHLDVVY